MLPSSPAAALTPSSAPPPRAPLYAVMKVVGLPVSGPRIKVRVANEDHTLYPPVTRTMSLKMLAYWALGYKGVEFYNDKEGTFFLFWDVVRENILRSASRDVNCMHQEVRHSVHKRTNKTRRR